MIKKVTNINLVPEDLQELIIPETGEYVVIGSNVYEIFTFPVESHLKLLSFFSKYFTAYNQTFDDNNKMTNQVFFGKLAQIMLDNNIVDEFFKIFPDIEGGAAVITFEQLQYLLGIIYKLNFLTKKKIFQNLHTNIAMQKMRETMGLGFLNRQE